MKLKLENTGAVTILTVTGPIAAENVPVLKAGLMKVSQAGKDRIVLDGSDLRERDFESTELIAEFDGLPAWAQENNFDLLVVAVIPDLGDVPGVEQAAAIFASPHFETLVEEALIGSEVRRLKLSKARLEHKLSSLKGEDQRVRELKRELTRLRRSNTLLEAQIRNMLRQRPDFPPLPPSREWKSSSE